MNYLNFAYSCCLIFFLSFSLNAQAQEKFNFTNHEIIIEGTSNIHDWEMEVEEIDGYIKMNSGAGDLNVTDVWLSIPVKSMKSGKGKMDSNTYEALKEDKNPNITFSYIETLSVDKTGNTSYKISIKGKLNIAGKTQLVVIPLRIDTNELKISSTYKITMTDYGVDPPTAVFGTIKTGDAIDINFNLNYTK
jgi:polyisoprenoid-binding protein YceI